MGGWTVHTEWLHCCTRMQAIVRGHLARKAYGQMRWQKHWLIYPLHRAASKIVHLGRIRAAIAARKAIIQAHEDWLALCEESAIKMQAMWRAERAKRHFRQLVKAELRRQEAAVTIQTFFRQVTAVSWYEIQPREVVVRLLLQSAVIADDALFYVPWSAAHRGWFFNCGPAGSSSGTICTGSVPSSAARRRWHATKSGGSAS